LRDTQRQKVYDAETAARDQIFELGRNGDADIRAEMCYFECEEDAQLFLNDACERLALRPVSVKLTEGGDASCHHGVIILPPWARQKFTALHELAHHMTPNGFPSHGAEYVENHLLLLRVFLPARVAEIYLNAYLAEGVTTAGSNHQATRFLAYARRVGEGRLVKLVLADGQRMYGELHEYDRRTKVVLKRGANAREDVPVASLRYATWAAE
jgi:small nuclear ribonucleoprotein (snRNP)-like protein